jgi:hypothetical protein
MFKCAKRQLTGWMAIVAMLWSALAPTAAMAYALRSGGSTDWQQICSVSSGKRAESTGETPAPASADEHGDHCPCCFLNGLTPVLPTADAQPRVAPQARLLLSTHEASAARVRLVWISPHTRAPPTYS